jgi:uncharacterized membrane protein YhdT
MAVLLTYGTDFALWALPLTGVFLMTYLISAYVTYRTLARPRT